VFSGIERARVLRKREEQRLEAAQMKFSRHLLGITLGAHFILHISRIRVN
jgi:hypothetical protein